jgi:hypothetical protein
LKKSNQIKIAIVIRHPAVGIGAGDIGNQIARKKARKKMKENENMSDKNSSREITIKEILEWNRDSTARSAIDTQC